MAEAREIVHATAVAHQNKGIMLIGPSGSGKSALALQLIGLGAGLIADDRVILTPDGYQITLSCPPTISGLIEARGIGVLNAQPHGEATLALVVDLDEVESERVPDRRNVQYFGLDIPLIRRVDGPHFAVALLHLLAHGRSTR